MKQQLLAALLAALFTCAVAQPAEVQRGADVMVQIDAAAKERARGANEARFVASVQEDTGAPWGTLSKHGLLAPEVNKNKSREGHDGAAGKVADIASASVDTVAAVDTVDYTDS